MNTRLGIWRFNWETLPAVIRHGTKTQMLTNVRHWSLGSLIPKVMFLWNQLNFKYLFFSMKMNCPKFLSFCFQENRDNKRLTKYLLGNLLQIKSDTRKTKDNFSLMENIKVIYLLANISNVSQTQHVNWLPKNNSATTISAFFMCHNLCCSLFTFW